jgi:hypothetical protein
MARIPAADALDTLVKPAIVPNPFAWGSTRFIQFAGRQPMRGTWVRIHCLSVVLLAAGCLTTQPNLKPPPRPEEFLVPPDDIRFSTPPVFPKEAQRDNNPLKKKDPNDQDIPGIGGPKSPSFGGGGGPGRG